MTEERNLEQGAQVESEALPATQQLLATGARRTGARDCRAERSDRRGAGCGADAGPRAAGGRAGHREDADREICGPAAGAGLSARAGNAGPDARRHSGHHDLPAGIRTRSRFTAGPVFTDLLLVDEINRMPPRTQAALLECMEERQVTSGRRAASAARRGSPCLLRRIRSTLRARIRCRRRSWTAFC